MYSQTLLHISCTTKRVAACAARPLGPAGTCASSSPFAGPVLNYNKQNLKSGGWGMRTSKVAPHIYQTTYAYKIRANRHRSSGMDMSQYALSPHAAASHTCWECLSQALRLQAANSLRPGKWHSWFVRVRHSQHSRLTLHSFMPRTGVCMYNVGSRFQLITLQTAEKVVLKLRQVRSCASESMFKLMVLVAPLKQHQSCLPGIATAIGTLPVRQPGNNLPEMKQQST